ncbi:MAG: carboxymuconolactone decarboxylase family protein [Gammaproteobacteria bacterium]|nr:carboxymuconolactone decarboxylase family protein [Gammaproteobacteria bacterium]
MARLTKLPPEQWDPELRAMTRPETASDLEQGLTRFFAHTPAMAKGLFGFGGALKINRTLPEKLIELVRLRVAFFNQCRSCMAIRYTTPINDGCTEDLVCSLERPEEAENLTPAEKIAIKYGELMATDHLRIDDAIYDELRKYYTEAQIVELGMNVAFFVGFGRLAATYHMVEELPEAFQTAGIVSPWNNDRVVVR